MAEAALVDRARAQSKPLDESVAKSDLSVLARALLVSEDGDWRLAVITSDVERLGRLGVARVLHKSAVSSGLGGEEISRLVVLGESDRDSSTLLMEESDSWRGTWLEAAPEFRGYVVWRSPGARRWLAAAVQAQLLDAFTADGLHVETDFRLEIGWRADLLLSDGRVECLVEIVGASPQSWKSRLRDAAGVANISGLPVVLVIVSSVGVPGELLRPWGMIPVLLVDWNAARQAGVMDAVRWAMNRGLSRRHP